ncbi:MAG: zinc-dependent alcohol dehydrogenase family protein [Anaerolineales bacterium]|nr:zinc-dependent alcohol dehydrogenase family protein [Anaerolineales bacterium]
MRAQLLRRPSPVEESPLEWSDLPEPHPSPGQIAIRVSVCGVCRTDLHIVEGELGAPQLPIIPGHQAVGRVCALGQDVRGWSLGERAGVFWLSRACGKCGFCLRGEENLCPDAEFTGFHRNGGYAEVMLAEAEFAVRIPDLFDNEHAAPLLCAGIIGYRSLRKAEVQPGETVGLFGFGASAHLALQTAKHWGCRVFVFTRSETHRTHARDLGAAWAGGAADRPPAFLDRAVIFAPSGALVPAALEQIRPGGTLAINAVYMTDLPALRYASLYGERTVRSVANATRRDAREFLELAAAIPIRVTVRSFGLTEANRVLQLLKESKLDGAAVLIPE